jgi:NTP pyrophosphatase (non-canonical NTP hydrolase)
MPTDSDTQIAALKDRVRSFCEARDWDQFHGAKDLAIGIATEAAELLEHFRFQSEVEVQKILDDPVGRKEIQDELADVLIFVLRFGQRFEVDLVTAVLDKLAQNEARYPVETAQGSNRKAGRDRP